MWGHCDCGAEQENAAHLAPQQGGLKRRRQGEKTRWRGQLPDQFCAKCESAPVKLVTVVPKDPQYPTRYFAACLTSECAHIRELEPSVI